MSQRVIFFQGEYYQGLFEVSEVVALAFLRRWGSCFSTEERKQRFTRNGQCHAQKETGLDANGQTGAAMRRTARTSHAALLPSADNDENCALARFNES